MMDSQSQQGRGTNLNSSAATHRVRRTAGRLRHVRGLRGRQERR
jgi:hypothetical protein